MEARMAYRKRKRRSKEDEEAVDGAFWEACMAGVGAAGPRARQDAFVATLVDWVEKKGANPEAVNREDGCRPLHWACQVRGVGSMEAVRFLVCDYDVDVTLTNGAEQRTALHVLGEATEPEPAVSIAKVILDHGGNSTIDSYDRNGNTPLTIACAKKNYALVRTLLT